MWKLLAIAFVIGSFSSETESTWPTSLRRSSHPRYDRDVESGSGPPPIVREYLQNLYNYRPQTAALEEEADFRSYNNDFNPIGPDTPGAPNAPGAGPVPDSENMESRSRDNYNHYQRPGSNDRGDRGDRSPFPPNPPYHNQRDAQQQRGTTRGPRLPPSQSQSPFHDDNGQGLLNTFQNRDVNRDDADYNLSDLPDDDEVELDAPFPNLNPSPRYNPNPNYNQRPPIRRPSGSGSGSPAQASCGGGGCGGGGGGGGGKGSGGGGGGLPKPPGNLYDDQTGRERGDPSYRFGYDLKDQSRHENADRFGNVNGYFSFVDDEGTFNKVSYSAGAAKGFVVNHKEPADASAAAQPPQRTRSTNLRRNPSDGGGAHRRNSNHASSYPPNPNPNNPRQHHNPYGKQHNNNRNQNNRQNQNQVPNTLNNNNGQGGDQPSQDEQLLGAGLGIVVGLTNSNKGGGGGGRGGIREGRDGGGDSWSRSKGPGAGAGFGSGSGSGSGVGSSTVVTTISSIGGDSNGGGRNHNSAHSSSDDPFATVNGTSDGGDGGDGDGADKGSWGALGGHGNHQNGNPRQRGGGGGGGTRKRKPAYIVKVTKRPAGSGNGPAWQYYKHANPGRPAPGSGSGSGFVDKRNHKWQNQYPRNNRPLPPPQNILTGSDGQPGSKSQGGLPLPLPLDGGISYDGTDGDGQDDYDPYPKDKSYSFGYKTGDSTRQEASDAYGNIRGSYSYVDPEGISRVVHYTAGNSGFKVLNAQPSILRPVYADSPVSVRGVPLPVTVQSLRSIPIPVTVTSSHHLSQLQQPSAIVYHIHPDNGIGSDWKPWESSRLNSLGPVYHRNNNYSHRSRNSHQFAPLISSSSGNSNSNKKSRSHRHRSQKQQILQGNTFRLTHQNHRFFPAYDNIYDGHQSQSLNQFQLGQQGEHADASASQDVTYSNPTFIDVNPDDVETISSDQLVNGLDNSADIEANQLYLKQLQRQQIRQQNKLRRLSQQYQQQIISTPVFQYSRRSHNDQLSHQNQRYSSRPSQNYFYMDRLQQQYPYSQVSSGDDNEILWTQPDQQYSDYQLSSPFSVGSQSNVVSVVVPHSKSNNNNPGGSISTDRSVTNNNSGGGSISTSRGNSRFNSGGTISTSRGNSNNNSGGNISTGRSTISTFPSSSNGNGNGNRRRSSSSSSSSRERGALKRSSSSSNSNGYGNRRNGNSVGVGVGNSREKSVPLAPIENSNSPADHFMSFNSNNSNNNVMNITEIFTSPAPHDVIPTVSIPLATPPMTMTVTMATPAPSLMSVPVPVPVPVPASMRVAVIEPADPDMQAYQGGYGVKHPLLPRPQSQSIETEMGGGGPMFSPGTRLQREIPLEITSDSATMTGTGTETETGNALNSASVPQVENALPSLLVPVMDETELEMVALPVMPLGLVVPGDDSQMAESIMNSVIIASSLVKGEHPGPGPGPGPDTDPESGSLELLRIYPKERKQNISGQNLEMEFGERMKMKGKKAEEFEAKSKAEPTATARPTSIPTTTTSTSTTTTTTTMKPKPILVKAKADPEPVVRMSPAARLAAKLMTSPTTTSTSTSTPTPTSTPTTTSSTTTTTTTASPSTSIDKEGQASSNIVLSTAIVFPMMMSNSGMVVHYPGGRMGPDTDNGAATLMSPNSSQEIMMMTA